MNIQSVLVLAVFGAWAAAAVCYSVKGKRRGCCGDCGRCKKRQECHL